MLFHFFVYPFIEHESCVTGEQTNNKTNWTLFLFFLYLNTIFQFAFVWSRICFIMSFLFLIYFPLFFLLSSLFARVHRRRFFFSLLFKWTEKRANFCYLSDAKKVLYYIWHPTYKLNGRIKSKKPHLNGRYYMKKDRYAGCSMANAGRVSAV